MKIFSPLIISRLTVFLRNIIMKIIVNQNTRKKKGEQDISINVMETVEWDSGAIVTLVIKNDGKQIVAKRRSNEIYY